MIGVGVSVGEHLDAARALAAVPLADTAIVRSTLQCALVKRAEHLDAFNLLFDLHFAGTGSSEPGPFAGLSDDELGAALRAAIGSGDPAVLRQLADEYVRRYAALEPGAPVAGVFAMIAASSAANLDTHPRRAAGGGRGRGGWGRVATAQVAPAAAAVAGIPQRAHSGNALAGPRPIVPSRRSGPSCKRRSGARSWPTAARARSARRCGSGSPRTSTSRPRRPRSWRPWSPRSVRSRIS